jgi:hypothetical protein
MEISDSNKDMKSSEIIQVDGYDHPLRMWFTSFFTLASETTFPRPK